MHDHKQLCAALFTDYRDWIKGVKQFILKAAVLWFFVSQGPAWSTKEL